MTEFPIDNHAMPMFDREMTKINLKTKNMSHIMNETDQNTVCRNFYDVNTLAKMSKIQLA